MLILINFIFSEKKNIKLIHTWFILIGCDKPKQNLFQKNIGMNILETNAL